MGDMTFNEFQEEAQKTAVYPQRNALEYLSNGIGGEVGELQGHIAKFYRADMGEFPRELVLKELGDIIWFVSELARLLGVSLGDVAIGNLQKLKSRQERGVLQGNGDNR